MKKLLIALFLVASLTAVAGQGKKKESFKLIHVEQLSDLLALHVPGTTLLDANDGETRAKYGIIPGAKLLTSSSRADVEKMLPEDRDAPVVFYCANRKCMTSHEAAEVAVKAGYANVSVLPDGIQGWLKARKEVMHSDKNP